MNTELPHSRDHSLDLPMYESNHYPDNSLDLSKSEGNPVNRSDDKYQDHRFAPTNTRT